MYKQTHYRETTTVESTYAGFYARFDTPSKKDAAILLGADNLVGDVYEIVFKTEDSITAAWMKNRFDALVGFFDSETTRHLQILHARGWHIQAILSFVAYTDSPKPGHYWGEAAVLCYAPSHVDEFERFIETIARRLIEGVRPEIDLGEQGVEHIIQSNGLWSPKKTVPLPAKKAGTVIMKSHRKISEKFIEQGRAGNKGCYLVSWVFLAGVVIAVIFGLKSCGIF